MAATFELTILTPEREFYRAQAEAVTVKVHDGFMTILANHAPMIASVDIEVLKIKDENGQWREAFSSEGFIEVRRDGVFLFTQTCEWPEEIDARRAEEALQRAQEKLRQQRSMVEYQNSKMQIARAMERLKVSKIHK
ncbi:MAG: ATP synthase F1 subunit epsilon [Oscillospiraceae bacterium]|jgi:F-type H+-transporting ATPase subunit epsilon|nr:ATP synthase F1 subunit epsilon [Oscillospiraceae bacterium]